MKRPIARLCLAALPLVALALSAPAGAELPPTRSWTTLVSSNGFGAVVVNLAPTGGQAPIHHFREHIFATEEPLIDASGHDVFSGGKPQSVYARDLLYDTYFGVRAGANQGWLKDEPIDLALSGFEGTTDGATGGTGIIRIVRSYHGLTVTQYVFAPFDFLHNGFVTLIRLQNKGSTSVSGVRAFSIHNFHLGFGRPGPSQEIGEQNETIGYNATSHAFEERGFAGVVVSRAIGSATHHGASNGASPNGQNVWSIVKGGGQLPDLNGDAPMADGSVSAFQHDVGDLAPGQEAWFGVVHAHHGDPFAAGTVEQELSTWLAGRTAEKVLADERASWKAFQSSLTLPQGMNVEQEALYRQSAVILRMAQVREHEMYVREWLTHDGEKRRSRFSSSLPATVQHKGKGAVLASLPPGEWTYAWPRDGAYAIVAMSLAGMKQQAKDALSFYLNAEGGRFRGYNELKTYNMPDYLISLTRYHGFGVEETDYNDFGPNLEFDGFGLFLWALQTYTSVTGDTSLRHDTYAKVSGKIADALVGLVDPATGLIRKDSSIWESHWNGRERAWTYTNITAVRGLCDAALMAQAEGDAAKAKTYRTTAEALRDAIAKKLTDSSGALGSTAEELATGSGYWDAAVLDAVAMGLFDPKGNIASKTLAGLDTHLKTSGGVGWSRNDDNRDHGGGTDASPWGSTYDDAEWVITDLRGAVAWRMAGDGSKSDKLIDWVRRQAAVNYLEVAETFDENTATYKFNAPMVGFGAGAWIIAEQHARGGYQVEPACGAYYQEQGAGGQGGAGGSSGAGGGGMGGEAGNAGAAGQAGAGPGGSGQGGAGQGGVGGSAGAGGAAGGAAGMPDEHVTLDDQGGDDGCGCRVASSERSRTGAMAWLLGLLGLMSWRRRRAHRVSRVDHSR